MSLATRPTTGPRRTRSRETTMTAEATARAAQPTATQTTPQSDEQPVTTPALGKAHPYTMGTCLNPAEAVVLRAHTLGPMTTWPVGKDGMVGAHFSTAYDLQQARLMLSALRSYHAQDAQQKAGMDR